MRLLFRSVLVAGITVFAVPALATDISVFNRDLYDRITFEPLPSGDLKITDSQVILPFNDELSDEQKQNILDQSKSLTGIVVGDNQVTLQFNAAVSDTRNFRIGNKVVLDLFLDQEKLESLEKTASDQISPEPAGQGQQKSSEQAPPKQTPPKAEDSTDNQQETSSLTPVIVDDNASDLSQPETPIAATEAVEAVSLQEDSSPATQPLSTDHLAQATIVNISSTTPFGLAVFERHNRLFVVTDNENMAIPPQISGFGAGLGWAMNEIPITGGKAWMMPLPEGSYLRPEGRGLIWRVIISDIDPKLKTVGTRRNMTDAANPSLDIMVQETTKLLKLTDPDYGDSLAVATANNPNSRMNASYDYVDFDILPAVIGTVIKPETDGLRIESGVQFLSISHNDGLTLSAHSQNDVVKNYLDAGAQPIIEDRTIQTNLDRIFYFTDWGGSIKPGNIDNRRKELDGFLAMAQPDNKLGVLLDMVKLTLSQGMGPEALGYLNIAREINPQISQTAEYKALRGAAHYLAEQYDLALDYFSGGGLNNISEAHLWLAVTYAAMGQDKKAVESYKDNAALAGIYPYEIRREVLAPLATAFLNEGEGESALPMIELLDTDTKNLQLPEQRATLAYLKGRAQSITGRPDEGIANLYKASTGDKLGPYGIRSEMLLIQDELAREVIDNDEALKRMERLRFAWRGDHLEYEIQRALGLLYIKSEQPRQGLSVLKRAASNAEDVQERRMIIRTMADAYKSIFIGDEFEGLDPLIAVTVYDEFKELTPVGSEGNALIDRLADKLMGMGLMSRAAEVLTDKMERLGKGQDAILAGIRIARISLLDRSPERALDVLKQVDTMMASYRGDDRDALHNQIVLLKAHALSKSGQPEQALFMTEGLDDTDDVVKLRVDTAWRSNNWISVTDNLSKLLARENISAAQPPTQAQAQLILNQAVALSLSDQQQALRAFANQYDMAMKQTPMYKTFLVVTRPMNISNLADRDTLLQATSEVDLFQGVLEQAE